MANPEHVALVRKGAEAIAEWRQAHPKERLDLSGANLGGARLLEANLNGADLTVANLTGANLSRAKLLGANLGGANFSGANLSGAVLWETDLFATNLSGAILTGAILSLANLRLTNLSGANLGSAKLGSANLGGADLNGADLSGAGLGHTSLGNTDLSQAVGLELVEHFAPSTVGADTLIRSIRGAGNRLTPALTTFFRGAGVPQELLKELHRIVAEVKYYSCFISYGQPDLEFATKLDKELRAKGVSCWTYEMDKTPGERTWQEIGTKRREADKMVLLCSSAALVRDGVLKEVEEQIDEDPDKMVPISLDDLWKERGFRVQRGERDLKPFLLDKNYADFANKPYDEALEELLKGLRRP